jgi:hypothetical protein
MRTRDRVRSSRLLRLADLISLRSSPFSSVLHKLRLLAAMDVWRPQLVIHHGCFHFDSARGAVHRERERARDAACRREREGGLAGDVHGPRENVERVARAGEAEEAEEDRGEAGAGVEERGGRRGVAV